MKPLPLGLLDALARRMLGDEAYDPMFLPSKPPPACECGHGKADHAAASGECMGTTLLRGVTVGGTPAMPPVRACCPCSRYEPARVSDPGTVTARHGRARRGAPWAARALGWASLGVGAVRDAVRRLRSVCAARKSRP